MTGRPSQMNASKLEETLARIKVSVATHGGWPAVVVTVKPESGFGEGKSAALFEKEGLPRISVFSGNVTVENAWWHDSWPFTMENGLVEWVSGRWACYEATGTRPPEPDEDSARFTPELDELRARLSPQIMAACRDAYYSPAFVEALEVAAAWDLGPRGSTYVMFGDDTASARRRAFARENPFLTEILFQRLRWDDAPDVCLDDGTPISEMHALLQAFRGYPWNDHAALRAIGRELGTAERPFRMVLSDLIRDIDPASVPHDVEGAVAFARVLLVTPNGSGMFPRLDPAVMLRPEGGDWPAHEDRLVDALVLAGCRNPSADEIHARLRFHAEEFAARVLMPLRARSGAMEPLGSTLPDDLVTLAWEIMFTGRGFEAVLGALRSWEARLYAYTMDVPTEADAVDEWPRPFQPATREGFALRSLASPREIQAAGIVSNLAEGPSLRAYAASGWLRVAGVAKGDVEAFFAIHWRDGRWGYPQPVMVISAEGETKLDGAKEALTRFLRDMPESKRPAYDPVTAGERARDICGYDWRDARNVQVAFGAFRPILDRDIDGVADALARHDRTRDTPSTPWKSGGGSWGLPDDEDDIEGAGPGDGARAGKDGVTVR